MTIDCIIPVCNQSQYTRSILAQIRANTRRPDRLFLIDNGSTDDTRQVVEESGLGELFKLVYHRWEDNRGVNAAWNWGLSRSQADIVAILNNDLEISPHFFSLITQVFESFPDIGLVIPMTYPDLSLYQSACQHPGPALKKALFREGWAFAIRRDVYLRGGPIPADLTNFYGDDWLWLQTGDLGYRGVKMLDNPIYHYVSRTLYASGGHLTCPADTDEWSRIMLARKNGKITPYADLPMSIDMAPYADFYAEQVRRIASGQNAIAIVELGTRYGCSARIMLDAIPAGLKGYLWMIDPIPTPQAMELATRDDVAMLPRRAEDVADRFADGTIDLLHVDVDPHVYEQTRDLFALYAPKVKPGGVIIFHDATESFGVRRFVDELAVQPNWRVTYCDPRPECPQAAPAVAYKESA